MLLAVLGPAPLFLRVCSEIWTPPRSCAHPPSLLAEAEEEDAGGTQQQGTEQQAAPSQQGALRYRECPPREGMAVGYGGRGGSLRAAPGPASPAVLQEEGCQAKRSPSSPQGGPKKRSAFGDITNVSALLCSQPLPHERRSASPYLFATFSSLFPPQKQAHKNQVVTGKKEGVKAPARKATRAPPAPIVAKNNEINLKK